MGRGPLKKRPHLISWKLVCTKEKSGGLGVKSLALLNRALLGKWVWRFAYDFDGIWKRLICIVK